MGSMQHTPKLPHTNPADGTLRVQVPNIIIIYLPQTCTIITITQNPSAQLLGTWTLWGKNLLARTALLLLQLFPLCVTTAKGPGTQMIALYGPDTMNIIVFGP